MMPKAGDIKTERNAKGKLLSHKWVICPDCGEGRWAALYYTKQARFTGRCKTCVIKAIKDSTWIKT